MGDLYGKLHNLYPVQKTLRFELIPIGKTKENIEKDGILSEDEYRAQIYKKVKKYCDEYHKSFIERALSIVRLSNLEEYKELLEKGKQRDDKQNERFKNIQELLRKEIVNCLKNNKEEYRGLFSKEIIETYLKELYHDDKEILEEIKEFKGFTTYFSGYNKNRENMYSDEEKSTAIAYRLINENLPTFLSNIKIYKDKLSKNNTDIITKVYKELEEYIQTDNLDDMFTLEYFNEVLTQRGIEIYNIIISGKTVDGNKKIKGLNEYINEYNQTHNRDSRIPKFKELYKQILSDKIGASFVWDKIENDNELVEAINEYYMEIKNIIEKNNLKNIFEQIKNYNLNKIYLNNDLIVTNISKKIFDDWRYIQSALDLEYDKNYTGKTKKDTEKYYEQRKEYFKKLKVLSIKYIDDCVQNYDNNKIEKIAEYFSNYLEEEKIISSIEEKYNKCQSILSKEYSQNSKELVKDDKAIEFIKEFLDAIKSLQEFVKTIIPKDKAIEVDEEFYGLIYEKYDILSNIIPLYNKARNYLTQKPYSNEKIKLNFETPTFLDGWDISKEKSNLGVLLTKDGNYYLGILTKKNKKIFDEEHRENTNKGVYKKIGYKLLPGPNKMLPKVCFAKSRIDEFKPSNELIRKYNEGLFKKGDKFDLDFCHELINFYKESINKNKDWQSFDFKFKETKEYQDISAFYRDVEFQGYKLNFVDFTEDYINQKIDDGELYLFKIYNKDFSKFSKGKPNLHTMYWKAIFDEQNLKNVVYKLNGNAEMFYRKSSLKISDTTIHKANVPIKNKSESTIKRKPTSLFTYDLIKDKRYTVDKFQINIPVTMNFKNQGVSNINEIVNKYLKYNDDIHIIGIDRGERNLIYVSVINFKGEIVYQNTLNEIGSGDMSKVDYHKLLDKKEEENMKARKSWKTISNIKELKEGYMSQVINELVKLIQKYNNSIIVLEDLNKGFKNSRTKVEKQVYQKFEQMLISKLNYLVIKDRKLSEEGGLLNAYQLTNQFDSFQKLGKQTGILFYIPAWNTSKIDPTTGFINLFYIKHESIENDKELISKFDDIRYNAKNNYFEFDIDYLKFTDKLKETKSKWTICTYSNRIRTFRNPNNNNEWTNEIVDITKELKILLDKYNIDLNHIKDDILEKADSKFFNAVKEKEGFYGFKSIFKLTLQMRNSIVGNCLILDENGYVENTNIAEEMRDYLISPVKNKYGKFFDTREGDEKLPNDADGNGAYNIARKGLMLVKQIHETEDDDLKKIKYNITNKEWLVFAQNDGDV